MSAERRAARPSGTIREPSDRELDDALAHYREHGWARLGKLADEETLERLRARVDAIMLGEITYEGMFFQHDSESGRYEDLAYGDGWVGPSLRYRKLEKLEKDPLFWAWMTEPVFEELARRVYASAFEDEGPGVSIYRAFLMNKHAGGGSNLPWHQDGGDFWGLDRDPVLQIWTALDDAGLDGGCVEVVDRSHMAGLVTRLGGVVPDNHLEAAKDLEARLVRLPVSAGEVLLIHNHVWHRSGRTSTGKARRALSVCYMDGATRCTRKKRAPRSFVRVF